MSAQTPAVDEHVDDMAHWIRFNQGGVCRAILREAEEVAAFAIEQARIANEESGVDALQPGETLRQTQIAYVMRGIALIDGVSQSVWGKSVFADRYGNWKGRRKAQMPTLPTPQTWRMAAFLNRYLGVRRTPARLAVEMYRHTPMHEGYPHGLIDGKKRRYMWSVSWEAPSDEHFRISPWLVESAVAAGATPRDYLLRIGTLTFLRGVCGAIDKVADDVMRGGKVFQNAVKLGDERWKDELTWTPRL